MCVCGYVPAELGACLCTFCNVSTCMGMFCESNDVLFDVYGCFFVPVANRYDGCFNGFDYDCCTHRRPNLYYPSLVKPFPYYYRCINRRVVYGRCGANQCVTESGSCGESDETLMSTFVYMYFE